MGRHVVEDHPHPGQVGDNVRPSPTPLPRQHGKVEEDSAIGALPKGTARNGDQGLAVQEEVNRGRLEVRCLACPKGAEV
eukprot:10686498-Alexandrium_andersonii.AAC.1